MRFFLLGLLCLCGLSGPRAQQCMPDPGPALFLEDFGSGPNPGPALPLGTTGYIYGSINPGRYVISNTSDLGERYWHQGEDRTAGDTDGYMLIVNAGSEGPILYQKMFTDLCPNTDYVFTAYIANLMIPTACIGIPEPPNVLFEVIDPSNDELLFSTSTGRLLVRSRLEWREGSIRFRTGPEQRELLIQLINNAPGRCGNDLALDDLNLRYCNVQREQNFDLCDFPTGAVRVGNSNYTQAGIYQDLFPVPNSCNDTLITTTISGATRVLPTLSYTICRGDTLAVAGRRFSITTNFVDTLAGPSPECPRFQPYEIRVQPPQVVTQDITICRGESFRVGNQQYRSTGTYTDSLRTSAGCDSIVITNLTIAEVEVEVTPAALSIELGQSTSLLAMVDSPSAYRLSWQPTTGLSCTDCLDPRLEPTSSTTYQVLATDLASGCRDSARVAVNVLSCEDVFVPNAFSPNFDRVNDQLELFTEDCFTRLISWQVFDRWGGQVYEVIEQPLAGNQFTGWDGYVKGQLAQAGVYSYQLLLERDNGTRKALRGEIILLR